MYYVPKSDALNLLPIIVSNRQTKSKVVSDEWRAYRRLENYGFKHFTVNHSKKLVEPTTKRHTQLIECLWNVAKAKIIKRARGLKEAKLPGTGTLLGRGVVSIYPLRKKWTSHFQINNKFG